MRYPDGGGLTAAGRARREKVRLQAAEWFAEGVTPPEVARRLRVSCNSAYAWRRRWRDGGLAALASRGPGGAACRLSGAQLERLRAALDAGPGRLCDRAAGRCSEVQGAWVVVCVERKRNKIVGAGGWGRGEK